MFPLLSKDKAILYSEIYLKLHFVLHLICACILSKTWINYPQITLSTLKNNLSKLSSICII